MIKLFNSLTRSKELFHPRIPGKVKMYTCGPTVYNFAHIGNFRTYIFEDLLRRFLKFSGFQVVQVMNITDVDDKTIKGANKEGKSLEEFTEHYTQAFLEDLETLQIEPVEFYPKATHYIPQMEQMIHNLLEKKIAYRGEEGSIYYSIAQFPSYGKLSHFGKSCTCSSSRINQDEYDKEEIADFVLWKAYDPQRDGNIYWESSFGKGRPGWHIECSAMAMQLLGEELDIHVGGVDNLFPHHENEIAQTEAITQKTFVRYWLHAEHLLVDHQKMSKSLGNFYTLRDLLQKGYNPRALRLLFLQAHYRTQLNFTLESLKAAERSLGRIEETMSRLQEIAKEGPENSLHKDIDKALEEFKEKTISALEDDLNSSSALAALFTLLHQIHKLSDEHKISRLQAQDAIEKWKAIDYLFALLPSKETAFTVPLWCQELLQKREKARKEKNWAQADSLRKQLEAEGWFIEDTPKGARLKKGG